MATPSEADEATRKTQLDRVEIWLAHTVGAQVEFRVLAADTAAKIEEPRWHASLTTVAEAALAHEKAGEDMLRTIGREPWRVSHLSGPVLAKSREALALVISKTTGASSPWTELQQLEMVSLGAISAFAVAGRLGQSIGNPALTDIANRVLAEKQTHHQWLHDAVLEFASSAILHDGAASDDLKVERP